MTSNHLLCINGKQQIVISIIPNLILKKNLFLVGFQGSMQKSLFINSYSERTGGIHRAHPRWKTFFSEVAGYI